MQQLINLKKLFFQAWLVFFLWCFIRLKIFLKSIVGWAYKRVNHFFFTQRCTHAFLYWFLTIKHFIQFIINLLLLAWWIHYPFPPVLSFTVFFSIVLVLPCLWPLVHTSFLLYEVWDIRMQVFFTNIHNFEF